MNASPSMIAREMEAELDTTLGGGDTSQEFWYLAGPMSNLPSFNFPAFHDAAGLLRRQGYNIVNPAQLDHEIERAVRENSEGSHRQLTEALSSQGLHAPTWAECLRRDIQIVSDENCIGVIVIDGWQESQGAQFETYVAYKLLKPIYELTTEATVVAGQGGDTPAVQPVLTEINRRDALNAAGVID